MENFGDSVIKSGDKLQCQCTHASRKIHEAFCITAHGFAQAYRLDARRK